MMVFNNTVILYVRRFIVVLISLSQETEYLNVFGDYWLISNKMLLHRAQWQMFLQLSLINMVFLVECVNFIRFKFIIKLAIVVLALGKGHLTELSLYSQIKLFIPPGKSLWKSHSSLLPDQPKIPLMPL